MLCPMPRTARAAIGGICYHVINRGNGRARVFHDDADYEAFRDLRNGCALNQPRLRAVRLILHDAGHAADTIIEQ